MRNKKAHTLQLVPKRIENLVAFTSTPEKKTPLEYIGFALHLQEKHCGPCANKALNSSGSVP
jgi:hypothetical protein